MPVQPGILLIDDDMGVREGLSELLSCVAPVRTADCWMKARDVVEQEPLGLVVSDYRMRDQQGEWELLASVHARGIPLILCTGAHPVEVRSAVSVFRPDALMSKPFSVDEMMGAVQRLYRKGA